jgi:hypothetical protein
MATSIRYAHQVEGAFKQLLKRFETAQKKINSSAAKRMKSGDYEAATEWMEVGRAFDAFSKKIVAVRVEWQELVASSQQTLEKAEGAAADARSKPRQIRIRTNHLYSPALSALVKRGGVASSEDIMSDLQAHILTTFPDSDLATNTSSPMWPRLVRKTYKHFQSQSWIERRKDGQWRVTEKGKSATAN